MAYEYKVKKGDTLNSIAQRYGFKNYKDAGISNVPSGNFDLIREGEIISLSNYDPNKINKINSGSPIISSEDVTGEFNANTDKLNQQTPTNPEEEKPKKEKAYIDESGKFVVDEEGDQSYSNLTKAELAEKKRVQREADRAKREYEGLFKTNLRLIDSNTEATIQRLNSTYEKRIQEQERINDINIARVKAYGLGGGGMYAPIDFSDAITNREREASEKVMGLESERDRYIREAKIAQEQGRADLLEDKMKQIDALNDRLNESLERIEKESQEQYKLLLDYRQEEEKKYKEKLKEMRENLALIATDIAEDFENATPEEKESMLNELVEQTGLDYMSVRGIVNKGIYDAKSDKLDLQSKELGVKQKQASITKTYADMARADRKEQDEKKNGTFTPSETKELEQAGLLEADRQTKLDYLYGDKLEKEDAKTRGTQSLQERVDGAGYDYEAMRSDGLSDEDIEKEIFG